MMLLKMKVSMAGPDFALSPGDETEVFSGDEARRLIDAGYAEEVGAPAKKQVERAVAKPSAKETRS